MREPSWNNRVFFPASNTLTFTKTTEAAISNSDSKSSILHLRFQLPSSYFSIKAVADDNVKPNSQDCPGTLGTGSGEHSRVCAACLNVLGVTTLQQPTWLIAAESPGC